MRHYLTYKQSQETNLEPTSHIVLHITIVLGQITRDQDAGHTLPIREDTLEPRATGNDWISVIP